MSAFQYLACPQIGGSAEAIRRLSQNVFRVICRRAGDMLEGADRPHGWVRSIEKKLANPSPPVDVWRPEAAAVTAAVSRDGIRSGDIDWLEVQLTVAGLLCGLIDEADLSIRTPRSFLLLGRSVTLPGGRLIGNTAEIDLRSPGGKSLWAVTNLPAEAGGPFWTDSVATSFVKVDNKPLFLLAPDGWHSIWQEECHALPMSKPVIDQFAKAAQFLHDKIPDYYAWVSQVLVQVTPVRRPAPNTITSNSSSLRWGAVDVAHPASLTETIEMLVHECSHQYFHLLSWVGGTTTAGAGEHYSPLKKCSRPLSRILIGYHAFANVALAYRELEALGMADDIVERRRTVDQYLGELAGPLEETSALSDLGAAIYAPLAERLGLCRV